MVSKKKKITATLIALVNIITRTSNLQDKKVFRHFPQQERYFHPTKK